MKSPNVTKYHFLKLLLHQKSLELRLPSARRLCRIGLLLLLGGPRIQAAVFINEDVTVNRTSGTVGGNVGIGTTTPGARLDINALTKNRPPLLRLQQRNPGISIFDRRWTSRGPRGSIPRC